MDMAIRKAYRLWVNIDIDKLPNEQQDALYDIDEDFRTKKEWLQTANEMTKNFNKKFNTSYTRQELFGEPDDIYNYRYCTICGEFFWADQEHECEG